MNLVEEGKLRPVIDSRYLLDETARVIADIGVGHVCGEVLIDVV